MHTQVYVVVSVWFHDHNVLRVCLLLSLSSFKMDVKVALRIQLGNGNQTVKISRISYRVQMFPQSFQKLHKSVQTKHWKFRVSLLHSSLTKCPLIDLLCQRDRHAVTMATNKYDKARRNTTSDNGDTGNSVTCAGMSIAGEAGQTGAREWSQGIGTAAVGWTLFQISPWRTAFVHV